MPASSSTWLPVAPPTAKLEPVDTIEVTEDDGRQTRLFQTERGVRFLRITEESGFVYWMQEVKP